VSDAPPHRSALSAGDALAECHSVTLSLLGAIDHGHATDALDLLTADASSEARGQQLRGAPCHRRVPG